MPIENTITVAPNAPVVGATRPIARDRDAEAERRRERSGSPHRSPGGEPHSTSSPRAMTPEADGGDEENTTEHGRDADPLAAAHGLAEQGDWEKPIANRGQLDDRGPRP